MVALFSKFSFRSAVVCCSLFSVAYAAEDIEDSYVADLQLSGAQWIEQLTADISNLSGLTNDAIRARQIDESGMQWPIPPLPSSLNELLAQLNDPAVKAQLPTIYQEAILRPFIAFLNKAGEAQIDAILNSDHWMRPIIDDVYQALVQNANPQIQVATDAFQEVASDLYDDFLYKESRLKIKAPDLEILPPLVKWGSEGGPYTYGAGDLTEIFGETFMTTVVVLPTSHLMAGLSGWSTLGHEVGGHDLLMADIGLLEEIRNAVYTNVMNSNVSVNYKQYLAGYWAYKNPQNGSMRVNETASDVLGTLHFGPICGMGMLAYFPGYFSPDHTISTQGSYDDSMGPHPISIIRPFVIAEVVRILPIKEAKSWAALIENEALKQLGNKRIVLYHGRTGYVMPTAEMVKSARAVAQAIAKTVLKTLENHSLQGVQQWKEADEEISRVFQQALETGGPLPKDFAGEGFFARHVVTAATVCALKRGANIPLLFSRMQQFLAEMHTQNPDWKRKNLVVQGQS